ncbi:carboxypeptidase-like regulatory domain-containing protein [Christiangramia portivictoriae]|uniref:carboxypeptidase-like regulatory domain-containing protein n=1 Tax=Christiangramia portivictoriae TaxID=326069 RepID=UPI000411365F|nr:carboxypeptidase-like regulatory domain-containing protein [Christiangramia portivictoriae]
MKSIFINLILLFFSQLLIAQTIRGKVESSISNKTPISDVYVEIINIDKPVLERMTSIDSTGFFKFENLEIDKTYKLEVSAFGYGKQFFELKPDDRTEILTLKAKCDFSQEQAEKDWKNGEAKLLLFGSIAPIANTRSDEKFQKEFAIQYYDFGCSPPIEECIKSYNEKIFELMDLKFGKKWRKKVRTDVEYL